MNHRIVLKQPKGISAPGVGWTMMLVSMVLLTRCAAVGPDYQPPAIPSTHIICH